MDPPAGWTNPITISIGQWQRGIDPLTLLPARENLVKARLDFQRGLIIAGRTRLTPILVASGGVIYDGHHAVRAAAEEGRTIDVFITPESIVAKAKSILNLPVR